MKKKRVLENGKSTTQVVKFDLDINYTEITSCLFFFLLELNDEISLVFNVYIKQDNLVIKITNKAKYPIFSG